MLVISLLSWGCSLAFPKMDEHLFDEFPSLEE